MLTKRRRRRNGTKICSRKRRGGGAPFFGVGSRAKWLTIGRDGLRRLCKLSFRRREKRRHRLDELGGKKGEGVSKMIEIQDVIVIVFRTSENVEQQCEV